MFVNRVLRRIFGTERDEVRREWTNLCNKELNDIYCTPNNIPVIVSRNMRLSGHVTRRGRGEMPTGIWWINMNERDHLEVLGFDGRVILKWNLNLYAG